MQRKVCLPAFILFLCSLVAAAQDRSEETRIRQLEEQVVQAILRSDTNLMKQLWAPEFLVNTPRNNIANGRAAVLEIQKTGLINYSSFEKTVEQVLIKGAVAIAMGSEWHTFSGNSVIIRRRFTNIWMKEGDRWRQVARHASVICE